MQLAVVAAARAYGGVMPLTQPPTGVWIHVTMAGTYRWRRTGGGGCLRVELSAGDAGSTEYIPWAHLDASATLVIGPSLDTSQPIGVTYDSILCN